MNFYGYQRENMKKFFLILSFLGLIMPEIVFAQFDLLGVANKEGMQSEDNKTEILQNNEKNSIKNDQIEDTYFSGFIEDIEAEKKAQEKAKTMLKETPKIIKLRKSQINELERNKAEREKVRQKFLELEKAKMKPEEKVQDIIETYDSAPLGLNWAITPDKMSQIGYELESVDIEDYPNSFIIKNYNQKNTQGYENVIVSFGENNLLWRINAQTTAQKDESNAKETLKLYDKYFEALSEKYGNANEHFSPYSYEEEVSEIVEKETIIRKIKRENPRGNPDFLKELQTGKAELYATFHNNNVGVTLSVYVDENSAGQLVLDYKNLPLMKKEKEAFINNL